MASSDGNSKTCNCVDGWEGDVCQNSELFLYHTQNNTKFTVTDNCDPNPCKEDGLCTNLFNDYSCECIFGLQGKDCSESMFRNIRL